jgi:hypothetical protein
MAQAIDVHRSGEMADTPPDDHIDALIVLAKRRRLTALHEALQQRYPGRHA